MLQNLKDQIKFKLAKILTPEVDKRLKIEERLAVADEKIASVDLYGIAPWYQENFWDPPFKLPSKISVNLGILFLMSGLILADSAP